MAGCPEPCDDHAKRTVEMGLEMIVAIRQFDIDRGQEVNMRVGIHTGKVNFYQNEVEISLCSRLCAVWSARSGSNSTCSQTM